MAYYVYMLKNRKNGKMYIGRTKDLEVRLERHVIASKSPPKDRRAIQHAIAKYGIKNFDYITLETVDTIEQSREREIFYIAHYKTNVCKYGRDAGYNLTDGGECGWGLTDVKNETDLLAIAHQNIVKNDSGCWIWQGKVDKLGIPHIRYQKAIMQGTECSVRMLLIRLYREKDIPPHKFYCRSKCGDKLCVNPEHLIFGSEARFWSRVDKTNTCWFWKGKVDKDGFGRFSYSLGNKQNHEIMAHKYAYEAKHRKSLPYNCIVSHYCSNRTCIRPDHLYVRELSSAKNISIEKLKALIWKIPITEIASKFGVTDFVIRSLVKKLKLEVPPRGYWISKRKDISKAELKKLLWKMSITDISKKFNVTQKLIGELVKQFNLSKPPNGYWTRKSNRSK